MTNSCQHCSKKIPISKVFLLSSLQRELFSKNCNISSKTFCKKFIFCTEEEKSYEIKTFAKRHNWHEELVIEKVEELFQRVLQVWINSILV